MKHEVNRPCMVCSGSASRLLHAMPYPDQGYPGRFEMRECAGCGLLFNSPRLSNAEIAQLYDSSYYVFQERERDAMRRVAMLASQTLGVASAEITARDLLEVGCAKGYLLAQLRAQGWAARGVELSADAADFARRRFGLEVFNGTIEAALAQPGFEPASVVLSTDVIEHVTDPLAFVRALGRALKPGGWLVLSTPNADSDHRRALGPQWLGFNPFHIYLFTPSTLTRLLRDAGFEIAKTYTYNNSEPPLPSASAGLRDAVRAGLRASGLLPAMRRLRQGMLALTDLPVSAQGLPGRIAAGELTGLQDYAASADARSQRGSRCRGDNLVVIARKPG